MEIEVKEVNYKAAYIPYCMTLITLITITIVKQLRL
jgi:hypothetical protein